MQPIMETNKRNATAIKAVDKKPVNNPKLKSIRFETDKINSAELIWFLKIATTAILPRFINL